MSFIFFQNDEIVLRKGLVKDNKAIAELIYSASTDTFNFIHQNKENALAYIQYEFKTSMPSLFGRTYSWVGEDSQGDVIASAIGFGIKDYRLMKLGTVIKTIGFYKWRSLAIFKRLLLMGKLFKPPNEKEFFLTCFAVSEKLRGKGLGELILKQQMKWAKENGYLIYGLDVSEKNPRAKSLYERLGLEKTKHKLSPTEKVYNRYKMEIIL